MRTIALGLLGVVLAVVVGLGVHLLTRETISLPVVRLEPAPALAPAAATTSVEETTTTRTESEPPTTPPPVTTETDDSSGRGRDHSDGDGADGDGADD